MRRSTRGASARWRWRATTFSSGSRSSSRRRTSISSIFEALLRDHVGLSTEGESLSRPAAVDGAAAEALVDVVGDCVQLALALVLPVRKQLQLSDVSVRQSLGGDADEAHRLERPRCKQLARGLPQ